MISARLYSHFSADPYYNMAFDNWLLGSVEQCPGAFVLRTYTWKVGTITFGAHQNFATAFDHARIGETPVIRRITGGRALYHDRSELTYAVAVNMSGLDLPALTGSVTRSSRAIAEAIAKFLASIGINADVVAQSSPQNSRPEFFHKAPCFASSARFELLADGGKVVASAQKRIGNSFLQHGSIKVAGVASHPALASISGAKSAEPAPMEEQRFLELTAQFSAAFGLAFGLSTVAASISERDHGEIMASAENLRAVERTIKQSRL